MDNDESDSRLLEAYIHAEDPRYPTLIIRGQGFIYGLDIDPQTGDIDPQRRCICSARSDRDCICSLESKRGGWKS